VCVCHTLARTRTPKHQPTNPTHRPAHCMWGTLCLLAPRTAR
jgi:hypothetical protein